MEQAGQYWMWMKRRSLLKSQFQAISMNSINISSSWEERAFAEDAAAGSLNGCIWPPRSYSCSFCKREFRSAQALGGHMNVHRRDRARLKQCLNTPPHNDDASQHQNHTTDPTNNYDLDPKYSASSTTDNNNVASTFSASRVSVNSSTHENLSDHHHTFVSPFSSPTISQENRQGSPYICNISDSRPDQAEKNPGDHVEHSTCLSHDDFVATDLFVGLSSFGDEAMISCKRPKTSTTVSALSFLIQPCSRYNKLQAEVIGLNSSSMEADIDLELRLGEPQKIK